MSAHLRKGPVYCEYCGELIEHAVGNRKYHPECAKIVAKKKKRLQEMQYRELYKTKSNLRRQREEKLGRKGPSVEEVMKEADKQGIQYAEYCKMHNL